MGNCEHCGKPLTDGQICPCQLKKIAIRQAELIGEEEEAKEKAFANHKRNVKENNERIKELSEKKDKAMNQATMFLSSVASLYKKDITQEEFIKEMTVGTAIFLTISNILTACIVLWIYGTAFFHSVMLLSPFGMGKMFFLLILGCVSVCSFVIMALEMFLFKLSFSEIFKRNATSAVILVPIGLVGAFLFLIPFINIIGLSLFYMYAVMVFYTFWHMGDKMENQFKNYIIIAGVCVFLFACFRMFMFI